VVAMGTAKIGIVVVVVALNVEHGEFPNEDGSEAGVQPRAASLVSLEIFLETRVFGQLDYCCPDRRGK